jgi:hypothetical protein
MQVTMSTRVNAPPDRTFAVFSDLRGAPGRVSGIKKIEVITEGPVGKGTKFRETRIMMGREATENMEVSEFEPGRSYAIACESCGVRWNCRFAFAADDGGTRVDVEMASKPVSLMGRLMSPLGALMAGTMKKCLNTDMDELRKAAEAPGESAK